MAREEHPGAAPAEPLVQVRNVTKRFRKYRTVASHTTLKTALIEAIRGWRTGRDRMTDPNRFDVIRDVSFDVRGGETVGVIGRNGAGKSTLLKIIGGIYKPDAGTVRVSGRVAALIELGAGFHPEFSGRENVIMNGMILGMSRSDIAARLDDIVAFAEIGRFIDAPVRTYSSGMFMRLAFSVAIHASPDVLLVDEVLAVGDEAFQKKCMATMESRIKQRRHTTVIVSHDLTTISNFCDRVVLIDPPKAIMFEEPGSAVAEFRRLLGISGGVRPAYAAEGEASGAGSARVVVENVSTRPDVAQQIAEGSGLVLAYDVRFLAQVEAPIVGIKVRRMDGVTVYGTNSHRFGSAIGTRAPGEGLRVEWALAARLTPGDYGVDLVFSEKLENQVVARVPDVLRFTVAGAPRATGGAALDAALTVVES